MLGPSGHLVYLLGLQVHDHLLSLTSRPSPVAATVDLTARELECLKWAAEGLTTEQIADRVMISAATVNYHFNKIVSKLDAQPPSCGHQGCAAGFDLKRLPCGMLP